VCWSIKIPLVGHGLIEDGYGVVAHANAKRTRYFINDVATSAFRDSS
jgi:hypothetical protein